MPKKKKLERINNFILMNVTPRMCQILDFPQKRSMDPKI